VRVRVAVGVGGKLGDGEVGGGVGGVVGVEEGGVGRGLHLHIVAFSSSVGGN